MISLSVCLPAWPTVSVHFRLCCCQGMLWLRQVVVTCRIIVCDCCCQMLSPYRMCLFYAIVLSILSHSFSPFFSLICGFAPLSFFFFLSFLSFFSRLHVNELALSRLRRQSLCDLRVIWRNWQLTTQLLISLALFEVVLVQLLLLLPLYNAEKFFSPIIRLVYWFVMFVMCVESAKAGNLGDNFRCAELFFTFLLDVLFSN